MQARIYNVSYYGKSDEESGTITLVRTEDIFADLESTARGVEVPILENVTEFSTEYSLNAEDWRPDWDMILMKRPPPYIKVTLRWEENNNEREFQFQVNPGVFY